MTVAHSRPAPKHFITISSRNSQTFSFCFAFVGCLVSLNYVLIAPLSLSKKDRFRDFSQIFLNTNFFLFCFTSQANYFRCIISFQLSYCSTIALRKRKEFVSTHQLTTKQQLFGCLTYQAISSSFTSKDMAFPLRLFESKNSKPEALFLLGHSCKL